MSATCCRKCSSRSEERTRRSRGEERKGGERRGLERRREERSGKGRRGEDWRGDERRGEERRGDETAREERRGERGQDKAGEERTGISTVSLGISETDTPRYLYGISGYLWRRDRGISKYLWRQIIRENAVSLGISGEKTTVSLRYLWVSLGERDPGISAVSLGISETDTLYVKIYHRRICVVVYVSSFPRLCRLLA